MVRRAAITMLLLLRRDLAALLLVFVLPPLVFVVLTSVFRETSTRVPDVHVAIVGAQDSAVGRIVVDSLQKIDGMVVEANGADENRARSLVESSAADVAVVLGADGAVRLLSTPGKAYAARLVEARLAQVFRSPDPEAAGTGTAVATEVLAPLRGDPVVLEEIGAVSALFLLLVGVQTAAALVDEREAGIYDRVASSGDVAGLVLGKFLFGILIGTLQALVIVGTAVVVFRVDVLAAPAWLLAACVLTAALTTALTLMLAACCSTRQQAQTISTFAILLVSAIGGSMVPVSLMPQWLARLSRLTPNFWITDAFRAALMVPDDRAAPLLSWGIMGLVAAVALGCAVLAYRRHPLL